MYKNKTAAVTHKERDIFFTLLSFFCLNIAVWQVSAIAQTGVLTLRAVAPDGQALPHQDWIDIQDINYNPVAEMNSSEICQTFKDLPNKPLQLSVFIEVPQFGKLNYTAANGGKGFAPQGQTLDVLYEVARHRYWAAKSLMQDIQLQGFVLSNEINNQMSTAEYYLEKAKSSPAGSAQQAKKALLSLQYSCPASEAILEESARQKLIRQGGLRSDQWISTFAAYESREGQVWRDAMDPLFDSCVTFWSWPCQYQDKEGTISWTPGFFGQDDAVGRLTKMGKKIRGHAVSWMSALPKNLPENAKFEPATLEHIIDSHLDFTRYLLKTYPEISSWVLANECNMYNNLGWMEPEDFVKLIAAISEEVKRINPQVIRGVVSAGMWSEHEAWHVKDVSPRVVAQYELHEMLIAAKVPYEYIGMQLYFGGRDLFEVHELLEAYAKLGKRIRVCEMEVSSQDAPMPGNIHFPEGSETQVRYQWHRDWDEDLQADWLEGMFLVCLSKDYVDEWNWWDLADYHDLYHPWGGLMDTNYNPKKAYYRLLELILMVGR